MIAATVISRKFCTQTAVIIIVEKSYLMPFFKFLFSLTINQNASLPFKPENEFVFLQFIILKLKMLKDLLFFAFGWIDPKKLSCFVFKLMTVFLLGWCDRQVWCTIWNMKKDGDTVDSHVTKHQWGWQDQRPRSATLTSLQLIGRYRPSQLPDQKMERGSII